LARAGVGHIKMIDSDLVEESNLQRQTLFTEKDIGRSKSLAAKKKLELINSTIKIEAINEHLEKNNLSYLKGTDLVLDCTDNLDTRLLINDFCKKEKILWIYSACVKTSGYVMPIFPEGPCLRCFLKEAKLDSACTIGVINTIPISISALQVTLAIKILTEKKIKPELFYYNIWTPELKKLKINHSCDLCHKTQA